MGEQDVIMRRLMQDKNVLADVINLLFFKGSPTVSTEELEDVD